MMGLALRIARQIVTALSILLVLGSALSTAQARTNHLNGMMAASSQPCHHALSTSDRAAQSPAEICLKLCLSQAPEASLVPGPATAETCVITEPAHTYVSMPETLLPARPVSFSATRDPKLRQAPYPASPRLLI